MMATAYEGNAHSADLPTKDAPDRYGSSFRRCDWTIAASLRVMPLDVHAYVQHGSVD